MAAGSLVATKLLVRLSHRQGEHVEILEKIPTALAPGELMTGIDHLRKTREFAARQHPDFAWAVQLGPIQAWVKAAPTAIQSLFIDCLKAPAPMRYKQSCMSEHFRK